MRSATIMSEERYEIRGKLGQGGLGAVYRAFDTNLNREVAIKRVLPDEEFPEGDEATESLIEEAKSLSSLNHPHVVSVYDAGVDEDGPYVIMELLNGQTLDDVIEKGSMTESDFHEFAIQTQEALIAAQALDIVHRDIKPGNVMLTWLPSGKFQTKLLDFGLAKFTPKPSLQTIDAGDAVMGSIHFMAPEQFERTLLDKRTDMYSLGCVYYFALTGYYPFDGESAPQVMAAHLNHRVTDLSKVRPDLPFWLTQWVMWHIHRPMEERPENARQSLEAFLNCEADPEAPLPFTPNLKSPANEPKKPRLLIPGAAPAEPAPSDDDEPAPRPIKEPVTITSPDSEGPSLHTTAHKIKTSRLQRTQPHQVPTAAVTAQQAPTAAVPVLSPTVSQPVPTAKLSPNVPKVKASAPTSNNDSPAPAPPVQEKKGLSNTGKAVIAAVMGILDILGGIVVLDRIDANRRTESLNAITQHFKEGDVTVVPLNQKQVDLVLEEVSSMGAKEERMTYFEALRLAEASDSTDIDLEVAKFATKGNMSDEVRKNLFKVLELRGNEVALPLLIEYAQSGQNNATNALAAARKMATPTNFPDLLAIIRDTDDRDIRQEAERTLGHAISDSVDPLRFDSKLAEAYAAGTKEEVKDTYVRLMGLTGGSQSAKIIKENLGSSRPTAQVAAINALSKWPDRSQFGTLLDYATQASDPTLRADSFTGLMNILEKTEATSEYSDERLWSDLFALAQQDNEKFRIIDGLVRTKAPWALELVKKYDNEDEPDRISFKAERAVRFMENAMKKENGENKEGVE
ncbi:MAG: protein kinase domain-containing protein [Verrucomicrobiales bacterium]